MSEHEDPRDELRALVTGFRTQMVWHAHAGTFAAIDRASPAPPPLPNAIDAPDDTIAAAAEPASAVTAPTTLAEDRPGAEDRGRTVLTLADVRDDLGDCQRCKLASTRNKIVFGVGSETAPLMFIGEAPGAEEDRRGEPFVGRAGQLLDRMIQAMGWSRDTVYIANVLKCRPPGNRDPQPDEVESCEPFLARQIDVIKPRIIVTLGKPAAHLVLRTRAPISALRGRFKSYRGTPVMPTFHPA
jgi:DNA polymerase